MSMYAQHMITQQREEVGTGKRFGASTFGTGGCAMISVSSVASLRLRPTLKAVVTERRHSSI
jgi:hypothetical protein